MTEDLLVSVIVPVRGGANQLPELLAGLRAQTLPRERFEVIIVDDGSREPVARRLHASGRELRLARIAASNSYAARNRGAELALGEVLAFTDVDCRPRPEWLASGVERLGSTDLVAGHIELLLGERLTVWSMLDAMLFDQKRFVAIGKAATANLFMRRALFERHHGFDASLASGGDWEFVERCLSDGARLAYTEAAVVEHRARSRAIPFLKRRWRIERAFGARCRRAGESLLRFNRGREPVAARRWGFAVGYDTRRLATLGVADRGRMWLASLPVRYAIIPAVDALAQATGYVRGA